MHSGLHSPLRKTAPEFPEKSSIDLVAKKFINLALEIALEYSPGVDFPKCIFHVISKT